MVLLNSAMSFFWGTRIPAAMAVLILGFNAFLRYRPDLTSRVSKVNWKRLAGAFAVLFFTVIGLRISRDIITRGTVSAAIRDDSPARQVAVATNGTQFDALALAVRDWPDIYPTRRGQDFLVGAVGWIPRSVWPGKPTDIAPGNWFRRIYEPEKDNGWPLTAVGEWFINLGMLGVAAGGFLSGAVLTAYSVGRKDRHGPWESAIDVTIGLLVFQMGFWSQAPVRFVLWLIPLGLVSRYVHGDTKLASSIESRRARPDRVIVR